MRQQRFPGSVPWSPRWRWVAVGVLGFISLGISGIWWPPEGGQASGGTPRPAVDRTEIDLGNRSFDTPVSAAFTLTNAGDGVLTIAQGPPVEAIKGC